MAKGVGGNRSLSGPNEMGGSAGIPKEWELTGSAYMGARTFVVNGEEYTRRDEGQGWTMLPDGVWLDNKAVTSVTGGRVSGDKSDAIHAQVIDQIAAKQNWRERDTSEKSLMNAAYDRGFAFARNWLPSVWEDRAEPFLSIRTRTPLTKTGLRNLQTMAMKALSPQRRGYKLQLAYVKKPGQKKYSTIHTTLDEFVSANNLRDLGLSE